MCVLSLMIKYIFYHLKVILNSFCFWRPNPISSANKDCDLD